VSDPVPGGGARPIVRWAGGKTWLVPHLPSLLPRAGFRAYHEPFLGGGSVFLAIGHRGPAYLSDLNAELIDAYCRVRDDPEGVIEALRAHRNTEEEYYRVRSAVPLDPLARAARFIFLNRTSFNGIYRVNLEGHYNVPYGGRSKRFLDPENLRDVAARLQGASLQCADFDCVRLHLQPKDLVFLDPPYTVSHSDNGFIKYNSRLFSLDDQRRLSELLDFVRDRGAYYLMTNAAHPTIASLFEKGDRRLELKRRSLVGGRSANRGEVLEYVFTNVGADG